MLQGHVGMTTEYMYATCIAYFKKALYLFIQIYIFFAKTGTCQSFTNSKGLYNIVDSTVPRSQSN